MRRRVLGVFHNIDDAKNALGQIKQASMNQVDLTVIIGSRFKIRTRETQSFFEMAAENFAAINLEDQDPDSRINHFWPGLKEEELSGIGVGYNPADPNDAFNSWRDKLTETAQDIIVHEIAAKKIIAFMEFVPHYLPKLRFIMESNGAELKEID